MYCLYISKQGPCCLIVINSYSSGLFVHLCSPWCSQRKTQLWSLTWLWIQRHKQICLCQAGNGIVFHGVKARCHLLNESGDLLWGGMLCLCLQCNHCTKAQPYISFDIIVLMQRVMDEHMFHTDYYPSLTVCPRCLPFARLSEWENVPWVNADCSSCQHMNLHGNNNGCRATMLF